MSLVINTNVASLNAQRYVFQSNQALARSFERLAGGSRINRASDDAAGLSISENLRAQIRGMGKALENAQDTQNMIVVVDGTLGVVQENLQRIRELTIQAANDTYDSTGRTAIREEVDARIEDIARITRSAQWNGIYLLNDLGQTPATMFFQIGQNALASVNVINLQNNMNNGPLGSATATALGVVTSANMLTTNSNARSFLFTVDRALRRVSQRRSQIGAIQNRLDGAISNLQIARENFKSADSRIRDADITAESARLTQNQILQQASTAILAQANQSPALALTLLRAGPG